MRKIFLVGAPAVMAALLGSVSANSPYIAQSNSAKEIKSRAVETLTERERRIVHQAGGLDLIGTAGVPGYSPKVYGMLFGHGNKRKHTNRLRCSHKAKLKRRL